RAPSRAAAIITAITATESVPNLASTTGGAPARPTIATKIRNKLTIKIRSKVTTKIPSKAATQIHSKTARRIRDNRAAKIVRKIKITDKTARAIRTIAGAPATMIGGGHAMGAVIGAAHATTILAAPASARIGRADAKPSAAMPNFAGTAVRSTTWSGAPSESSPRYAPVS